MDLTQLTSQLKVKTDFNANSAFGLSNINGITGIVDNSVSSLQALIFSNRNAEYDDYDPTKYDVTGITSGYDGKAFIFDLKKDYKLNLSSDITDHYVESNVAIQDHIGLKPIIIEVVGSIAEVDMKSTIERDANMKTNSSNIAPSTSGNNNTFSFNSVDSYLNRMGSLTSFAPNLSNQSLNIYNTAKYVYATTNKVINLDKKDSSPDIKERRAYDEEYNLDVIKQTKQFEWINWFKIQWWNRASFTIVTPYGSFSNMYIVELSAVQPESTRFVTNLTIKFKQIRRAKIIKASRQVAQKMEAQNKEHGLLVRKDQYGNIIVDATQDMTEPVVNGNYDLGGSKILNEGATYNVPKGTGEYLEQQVKTVVKSFGIDPINYSKYLLGQG